MRPTVHETTVWSEWRCLPPMVRPPVFAVWLELEERDEDMPRMERGLRESLEESDPYSYLDIERMMLRDPGYAFMRSG